MVVISRLPPPSKGAFVTEKHSSSDELFNDVALTIIN
jgi:hypothetical protein